MLPPVPVQEYRQQGDSMGLVPKAQIERCKDLTEEVGPPDGSMFGGWLFTGK